MTALRKKTQPLEGYVTFTDKEAKDKLKHTNSTLTVGSRSFMKDKNLQLHRSNIKLRLMQNST